MDEKVEIDDEQMMALKADYVIFAFGCQLDDPNVIDPLKSVEFDSEMNLPIINTMMTNTPGLFCGDDLSS